MLAQVETGQIIAVCAVGFTALGILLTVLQRTSRNSILKESNDALVQRVEVLRGERDDGERRCHEQISERDVKIAHLEGRVDELRTGIASDIAAGVVRAMRDQGFFSRD